MEEADRLYQDSLTSYRSGDLNEAIRKLQKATQLDPAHTDALEALGVLFSKVDRLDEAIETMRQLAKTSPNHIMAHANLSRFYAQKGLILEAEHEQAEARRLSWKADLKAQKTVHSQARTPEQEAKDQERELQSRIERYKKVIELDPKDVLGYFSLGTAYMDGRRLVESREAFERAISVDPNHSPSYFNLGIVYESLNEKNKAIHIYEKGLKIADSRGDMIPLRKMEARLEMLRKSGPPHMGTVPKE